MDERLKSALEQANYSVTIQTQKKNHQLRFQNALSYSAEGGTFTVSPALISFVDTLIRNDMADGILIDDRGNPILIPDLKAFLATILDLYQQAANELRSNMEKLKRSRTTKATVGL